MQLSFVLCHQISVGEVDHLATKAAGVSHAFTQAKKVIETRPQGGQSVKAASVIFPVGGYLPLEFCFVVEVDVKKDVRQASVVVQQRIVQLRNFEVRTNARRVEPNAKAVKRRESTSGSNVYDVVAEVRQAANPAVILARC